MYHIIIKKAIDKNYIIIYLSVSMIYDFVGGPIGKPSNKIINQKNLFFW